MARRRKKKGLIEETITALTFLSFVMTWSFTKSFVAGGIAAGVILGVSIVVIVMVTNKRNERLRKSGINEIDNMDGFQFEKYLAVLFRSLGYKTEVTRATGDYGADLILNKDGRKIVVQAKCYSKNVGIKAIQEAFGSKNLYNAQEVWAVTNRYFTDAAITLAKANNVRLINRDELIELIFKANPESGQSVAKKVIAENPERIIVCDRCGSKMVLRKSSRGEFYGCSSFPRCRNIKAV